MTLFNRSIMRFTLAAALSCGAATTTIAAETDWVRVAPEAEVRLISDGVVARDGTFKVGLHIRMPQHVKTYWRVPGDTGIPADFDHQKSANLQTLTPLWPYPERDIENGNITHVYHGDIVLPFVARAQNEDAPVAVRLNARLGVCSDICVPVEADLSLDVQLGERDRAARSLLKLWEARTPIAWPQNEAQPFTKVAASSEGDSLTLELKKGFEFSDLFVEGETGDWFFGRPQKRPGSLLVDVPLLAKQKGRQLKDATLRLTFGTVDGPYEMFWNAKKGLYTP